MAIDVLNDIKAAEEKAQEIRRVAAIAAKDAVKLASQENAAYEDEELTQARRLSLKKVDEGRQAAKAELEKQQAQRLKECEALKENANKRLTAAADVCLERILK
jgi:V/A-type H+-transporting ATPase subunit G/H